LILAFRHFTDWFHLSEIAYWPKVIGISFFVFRSMGYVLDVYREMLDEPEKSPLRYLSYLSFFPLILAGPISPARDFLPQLGQAFQRAAVPFQKAAFLIASGIVKKYILSNYLAANFVDRVFEGPQYFSGIENLMATIAQALVVYLDFSGYTDLMLGIALLLGFRLSENFNFPYISGNITEYWRRWHMSLSKWLNEYLFFPLSFAMRQWKRTGTVIAVFITFIISGFWHGTAFHYTFWGILHAIALGWDVVSSNLRAKIRTATPAPIYRSVSVILTFAFLALSGIYFKAPNMEYAQVMFTKIFSQNDLSLFGLWMSHYPYVLGIVVVVFLLQILLAPVYEKLVQGISEIPAPLTAIALALVIFVAYQVTGLDALPFIYLEF
jgi:alginate O-acetyltransferase complex protein AlgI